LISSCSNNKRKLRKEEEKLIILKECIRYHGKNTIKYIITGLSTPSLTSTSSNNKRMRQIDVCKFPKLTELEIKVQIQKNKYKS